MDGVKYAFIDTPIGVSWGWTKYTIILYSSKQKLLLTKQHRRTYLPGVNASYMFSTSFWIKTYWTKLITYDNL